MKLEIETITDTVFAPPGGTESVGLHRVPFPPENPNGWLVFWVPNHGSSCMTFVPFPPKLYHDHPLAMHENVGTTTEQFDPVTTFLPKIVSDNVVRFDGYFRKTKEITCTPSAKELY